jgi:hypothetical protein
MDRYARQRLLATVGDQGQQRIAAATYVVRSSSAPASEVERAYLARAGAERFAAAPGQSSAFAHQGAFKHTAARDFAEGAWHALVQLRSALEPS